MAHEQELPVHQRADAVSSLVYEANARVRDPVYGCVGAISYLQSQVSQLKMQLAVAQTEIMCLQMQQDPTNLTSSTHQIEHYYQDDNNYESSNIHNNVSDHHQYLSFASSSSSSSNVIQDPFKRESLWS